jgi:hypothetical protein
MLAARGDAHPGGVVGFSSRSPRLRGLCMIVFTSNGLIGSAAGFASLYDAYAVLPPRRSASQSAILGRTTW